MKKNILLKKVTWLLCAFSFLIAYPSYSQQCTNPVPSGNSSQSFCAIDQNTIADLAIMPSTIDWYDEASAGNKLISTTKLQNGVTYYADNNADGGCSPSRFAVIVTINSFPPETFPIEARCAQYKETIASLRAFGDVGAVIQWYSEETGGTPLDPTHILEDDTAYWAEQIVNSCNSARSGTLVLLVAAPTPTINESQSFCSKPEPTVADLVATNVDPGSNIDWYDSDTSETPLSPTTLLITGRSYWASVINILGCESAARTVTTVTIDIAPNAGSNGVYPNCEIDSNVNLFDLLGHNDDNLPPDKTGAWSGPSELGNGYLGTYDPFLNFEGIYTYTVKSSLGVCDDAVSTVKIELVTPPVAAEDQLFCEIDNPIIADLQADGINLKWYPDNSPASTPLNSTTPLTETDYWATQTDENGCESSPRVKVTVTINTPLAPTTTEPTQTFCEIEDKTVGDLIAEGTDIKWYITEASDAPLNTTDLLVTGSYWATQTDSDDCESKNRLEVVVTTNTTLPPTTPNPNQSFCLNDFAPNKPTIADLTVSGDDIKWYDTEDSTVVLSPTEELTDGDYWATQTDITTGCESKIRLQINVTLLDPQDATAPETNQTFCFVDKPTIANIQVTGDTIIWYDSIDSTTPLNITDALINGESYWALNTIDGCESLNRLEITVAITDPNPPIITEPIQTFCGSIFPTVGDLDPSGNIVWYSSSDWETDTVPLNISDLLTDGIYWAANLDPSTNCISSKRESVTVVLFSPAPPTTSNPNQTFCEIDEATIADLDVSGVDIVWYDSKTSTIQLSTSQLLADGIIYWAAQNTDVNGCESERLPITAIVNTTLAPTGDENQSFCLSDNPTIASINVVGTAILWYASETSIDPLNTTNTLVNGDSYWASQTDDITGCESKLRLKVTTTILSVLDASTSNDNQNFCFIDNPTISNIEVTGNTIIWFDTETSTTPLANNLALVDGEQYWALNTDPSIGCESLNRLMVAVTVTDASPPIIDKPIQTFCLSYFPTISNLEPLVDTNWYNSESNSDETPLQPTELLIDGKIYWAANVDPITGCISSVRVSVTVNLYEPLPPTSTDPNPMYCEIENRMISDLAISGTNIKWYADVTSTANLDVNDLLVTGSYWASQTDTDNCESSRLEIKVIINNTAEPTTSNENQSFCKIDNPTISEIEITGTSILWYQDANDTTPLDPKEFLVDGNSYWASQTDAVTNCESKLRLQITVSLIDPPMASTSQPNQTFCLADNPIIANFQVTGDKILWYATETSTEELSVNTPLENGISYWALNTDTATGCESDARLMVTATVVDAAPPVINKPNQFFCASDAPTVSDLEAEGTVLWFSSATDPIPLSSDEPLINGNEYWAATVDNSIACISSVRVPVNVTLTDPGAPILEPNGNEFCSIDNPTINDLNNNIVPTGYNTVLWFDAYPPKGIPLEPSRLLVDGQTYYAIQIDENGCSSMTPLEVTVDLSFCDKYEIELYDGFSPNGDGINDTFTVKHLRILYPDFTIEFVNRWGAAVYSGNNNKPDWNGRLNGDQELVPSGVYYVIINFNKDSKKPIQNRLYLSR